MFQFTPVLFLHCVCLITSRNVDGSSVQTGVIMCQRWCERRSWCSEAMYDPNLLQCSSKTKTHASPGQTVIPIQQHLCETCPLHHVCLRKRTGSIKCVKEDTTSESITRGITSDLQHQSMLDICKGDPEILCPEELDIRQGRKTMECRGKICYVELVTTSAKANALYYSLYVKCPVGKHGVSAEAKWNHFWGFDEQKIYHWVMTIQNESIRSRKRFSFQLVVSNRKDVFNYQLKKAEVYKAINVAVSNRITFKSFNGKKFKSRERRRGPDRYAVVLDKIKGRMFVGNKKFCFAAQDSINVSVKLYVAMIFPKGGIPSTENKMQCDNIQRSINTFSDVDVEELIRRCGVVFTPKSGIW